MSLYNIHKVNEIELRKVHSPPNPPDITLLHSYNIRKKSFFK